MIFLLDGLRVAGVAPVDPHTIPLICKLSFSARPLRKRPFIRSNALSGPLLQDVKSVRCGPDPDGKRAIDRGLVGLASLGEYGRFEAPVGRDGWVTG